MDVRVLVAEKEVQPPPDVPTRPCNRHESGMVSRQDLQTYGYDRDHRYVVSLTGRTL